MTDIRAQLQATLGGDYTLERELGGGGMSRVFVARETALGRDVVVKVLAPDLSAAVSAERFTREIATTARLQQANIVPVLSAGTSGGVAYYTMPFVRGESLRALLSGSASMSIADRVSVLRDVARALAYAHGEGVIHRDIKPENILLSGGAAVVTDFGIARAISASRTQDGSMPRADDGTLTQVGTSIGTPAYMAPEQALGEAVDHRADLYAWGVVAYETLAGVHPFGDKSGSSQLIAAHIAQIPQPLSKRNSEIPREVAELVTQCLAKNRDERPASATDLLARLGNITTTGQRVVGSAFNTSRTPLMRFAVPVGALALVAVAALWFTNRRSSTQVSTEPATQTVVVIPFDNLGASEDAYFADGITDEIAGRLARIPGLRVVARASVLRYRGSSKSPQEIAQELGAAYALSGTIRWARAAGAAGRGANDSTMVRIVPALIRTSTGAQLWGEPLQQRLTDVFKVQADVAERVAAALSLTLGASDLAALRRPDSRNADAQDAQLLGRDLLKRRGLGNLQRAAAEFRRAIALDSSYARAWAGYSEAVGYLPVYGDTMSIETSTRIAAAAARRALALDSLLADGHVALALALEHDQQFASALASAERATVLDPGSATAWKEVGVMLEALGRPLEAEKPLRRALELEPLLAIARVELAGWFASAGQPDSGLDAYRKVLELEPTNVSFRMYAAISSGMAGRPREARAYCVEATGNVSGCRDLWRDRDDPARVLAARSVLDTMAVVNRTPTAIPASFQAVLYAQLGATDSAFSRLSAAVRVKDPFLYNAINHPLLAPLHRHPGWAALLATYRGR